MKITQFRKMLSVHGADFARWDGVGEAQAKEFLRSSPEAQGLYAQAQALDRALDSFKPGYADQALLDKVMRRIDGDATQGQETTAQVLPFALQRPVPAYNRRPFFWGGAVAACAAAVAFYVLVPGGITIQTPQSAENPPVAIAAVQEQMPQPAALAERDEAAEIDMVLAALDDLAEVQIAEQEVMGLWRIAETSRASGEDSGVDGLIDTLIEETAEDPLLHEDIDLLNLLPPEATQRL